MEIPFRDPAIASRQNRKIVELCKLNDRRTRESTRLFRFDGIKLFCEALRRNAPLKEIFLRESEAEKVDRRMKELCGMALSGVSCPIWLVKDALFDRISDEKSPEGVICVSQYLPQCRDESALPAQGETSEGTAVSPVKGPVILLESVRDPLNVGAIIRSAAALGVGTLIVSEDCADIYHPRTVRAAMGPLFSLPVIRVRDLPSTVTGLRASGFRMYAAALDDRARRLGSFDLHGHSASNEGDDGRRVGAVIGNEGHGLSDPVRNACDESLYIPMQAGTESLNAGVAAALIMWELCRF